jgi:glycosyltransferase involved in cell wall biosynthesis
MLFSILMAHYNNAKFLEESLASIYAQTYTNWELVLVDDGSTDDFDGVMAKYKNDSRIKIFYNGQNKGTAFTKAKCVALATGEIAGYLDPDDTLHEQALAIMVTAHQQHVACSIIYSAQHICDAEMNITETKGYSRPMPPGVPYLLLNDGSIHHFVSFKMACYNKLPVKLSPVREYDKASDQELYYLLEEAGDVLFVNKPLYNYRIHTGGISNFKNTAIALQQHYKIIEKACLRRMELLKHSAEPGAGNRFKEYKTRYHKIRILNSYRNRQWLPLVGNLFIFPFVGGMSNVISYARKLPRKNNEVIKKLLPNNYRLID